MKENNNHRQPAIELLRCLLMFLIVAHHSFHWGVFSDDFSWWTLIYGGFTIWHVDAFIAISGWFGMRFAPSKVLRLIGLMAWYSALSIGYLLLFDRGNFGFKSIGIHGGWFGETYLMFLFVVPLVNAAIERLISESTHKARIVWIILAVAYALTWLPGHLLLPFNPSGLGGQSLFLFFFIYFTMRFVKFVIIEVNSFKPAIITGGGGVFTLGIMLCGGVAIVYRWLVDKPFHWRYLETWSWYDAPHVWIFAVCLVAFFATKVILPERAGNVCCWLSPSMFGVYLMHNTTSFGRLLYVKPEQWLSANTCLHPAIIVLISAIGCFTVCLMADLFRRALLAPFASSIKRMLDWLDRKYVDCLNYQP